MAQHPAFKKTTRVCAICGKALRRLSNGSTETTYGFRGVLSRNGIRGDKAHPSCVNELALPKPKHKQHFGKLQRPSAGGRGLRFGNYKRGIVAI